jgi:trk system potassium uptake protein TrkA
MQRFVVVGLGHFGAWLAQALYQHGHEVIGIDSDPRAVDRLMDNVTKGVVGDATSRELLEEIGVEGADAAVVSTGNDLAASVLTTQALRELHVRDIFVKVASPEAARVSHALGVTDTIFPEREAALRLAHRLGSKVVFDYVPLAQGCSLQEIAIPDLWIGRSLRELALPRSHGITVVAIYDVLTGTLQTVPDPDAPLKDSDLAVVVGKDDAIARVIAGGRGVT